jgi:hypothetical protein
MLDAKVLGLALEHARKVGLQLLWILHSLWLQVVGLLFLVIAAWGLIWILRTWQEFHGDGETLFKMALVAFFVFMMGSFGVSSFWRARRISRHK